MNNTPLVIVNPASAGGATRRAWPSIASELRRHFGPFECAFTERETGASVIAEREARAGRRFIIATGGDGTVSETADGILRSGADAELGLLPSGTGGDFRRTLKIPTRTADAALALRRGATRTIDAGRVTYTVGKGEETRHFVNVASFGMGGDVIRRVKENNLLGTGIARLFGGRVSFAASALRSALEFERPRVGISLDGGPEAKISVTNFCIANGRYFGGGMHVAPAARLSDGLLDCVSIGDLSTVSILFNSYRVYLGTHLGMKEVRHARVRRAEARPVDGNDVRLEIDGELVGILPATFEVLPRALRVRVPV